MRRIERREALPHFGLEGVRGSRGRRQSVESSANVNLLKEPRGG